MPLLPLKKGRLPMRASQRVLPEQAALAESAGAIARLDIYTVLVNYSDARQRNRGNTHAVQYLRR